MTLGPSPLLFPVQIAWPLPAAVPPEARAELEALLTQHNVGPDKQAKLRRVVFCDLELTYEMASRNRMVPGGPSREPLHCHPSAALLRGLAVAGALQCTRRRDPGTTGPQCNVLVDDQGRHTGRHVDGRYGDEMEWPNLHPAPAPAGADVTADLTATRQAPAPARRRRGVYVIGDATLARAMRLPEGQHVIAVSVDFERLAVLVKVEGEGLPEVGEGEHARTIRTAAWWTSAPSPAQLAAMPPAERHTAVLAAVGATALEDAGALQGRLRILARHAPDQDSDRFCVCCVADMPSGPHPVAWPCPDYLDAAGDVLGPVPA
jgi:hypothetical protein